MTFNWGHKLILVFLVFGGGMSYLVYRSVKTNFDLVSKEYYRDELQYQQVIDGTRNANQLSSSVKILQEESLILIKFPEEMKDKSLNGTILFYCAADAGRDRKIDLQSSENGIQKINTESFSAGKYIVKISWESGDLNYYMEKSVIIH